MNQKKGCLSSWKCASVLECGIRGIQLKESDVRPLSLHLHHDVKVQC